MHRTAIIVMVDNDACAYVNGKLHGDNIDYINFQKVRGAAPDLALKVNQQIPDKSEALKSFKYLIDCIMQGWSQVEALQPKELTWLEALRKFPMELFVDTVFDLCQMEKDKEGLRARLSEEFPKEIAPALHLITTGALSLIPCYVPAGNDNSRSERDNESIEHAGDSSYKNLPCRCGLDQCH